MKRPEDMNRDELEEEVAYLRGELGLALDKTQSDCLYHDGLKAPAGRAVLLALMNAYPRWLSRSYLFDRLVDAGADTQDTTYVRVAISFARKHVGRDAIATSGVGYRLTDKGLAALAGLGVMRPADRVAA